VRAVLRAVRLVVAIVFLPFGIDVAALPRLTFLHTFPSLRASQYVVCVLPSLEPASASRIMSRAYPDARRDLPPLGTSASLFTASFHCPTVLKMPKRSSSRPAARPLSLAFAEGVPRFRPGRRPTKPHHATKHGQAHSGARGVEQIVWNFSEAIRVSLYPCPNLLARSRASNHKQGHDVSSSHTDRVTLRKA
jgi:hypothetical protein